MAASPAPTPDSDDPTPQAAASLTEWLRRRDDRQLAQLLRLRPDLALPAAPDIAALASRLGVRTSAQRCVDALDSFTLRVLDNLVLAADDEDTVRLAAGEDGAGHHDDKPDPDAGAALDALLDRALVWGEPGLVHLAPTVRDAVGLYPAGLGRPAAALFDRVADIQLVPVLRHLGIRPMGQPAAGRAAAAQVTDARWLAAELAGLDDAEHDVLDRLAAGPPVGTVRSTRAGQEPGAQPSAPHRLIERGLVVAIDTQRVELPREVGEAVRGAERFVDRLAPTATPPPVRLVEREPAELDGIGTVAVLEFLRLADTLAETWSAHPPAVLRSGGLGVRELKRTAKELGVDDAVTALVAEVLYAAALVNSTSGPDPVFLPTPEYDAWRRRGTPQRWRALAEAWLAMTRQPSLAGQRGERDRVITALGPDAERGTTPALRRQVLDLLAELAPGAAPRDVDQVLARFTWQQPRRATAQVPLVRALLAEADLLGVSAAGGLTGYTRTLLAGSAPAAEHALDHALPAPVDHFLVQPDLTVVVPGPPTATLGTELGLIADLESTGGASVYRITERSVRRALDAGRSAASLSAFVGTHSRTPIPQALSYLIDDAARRHGILRTGTASAYLRCDDEALLSRVLAERELAALGLRRIAPTVVICGAPVTQVLDQLREAGFAPAAESPDGELVTIGVEPPRAHTRPPSRVTSTRAASETDAHLGQLVRRLRSGDALAGMDSKVQAIAREIPGVASATTMDLLRTAVRESQLVWFGCAETDGRTTAHVMRPISLAAGALRGYEQGRAGLASYPVHRITAMRILDDAEDADDVLPGGSEQAE